MMRTPPTITRRHAILSGTASLAVLTGCVGHFGSGRGPSEKSFDLTIIESGDTLELLVNPAGDVKDVISLIAGDEVTFALTNECDKTVGLHHHTNDEKLIIEPSEAIEMAFTATENMIGRHEIEGWIVDENSKHDADSGSHHDGHETSHEYDEAMTVLATVEVRPSGSGS